MNDVFPSSETYDLDPRDLADLPDAEKVSVKFDASVVVLLGDERKGVSDALLKGRSAVETAAFETAERVASVTLISAETRTRAAESGSKASRFAVFINFIIIIFFAFFRIAYNVISV